ncbi:MAG: hypothetical protein WCG99_03345 [Candidatus Berkelbacteria bacterium]
MPNIHIVAEDHEALELVNSASELPDGLAEKMIITQHLHCHCIKRPSAMIAASDEVPDDHLAMVVEAIKRANFEMPEHWRYTPLLPHFPNVWAIYYSGSEHLLDDQAFQDIGISWTVYESKVFDLRMNPAPYAEVRTYPAPDVNGIMRGVIAASKIQMFMDVELYASCGGKRTTRYWPQGANLPITED